MRSVEFGVLLYCAVGLHYSRKNPPANGNHAITLNLRVLEKASVEQVIGGAIIKAASEYPEIVWCSM